MKVALAVAGYKLALSSADITEMLPILMGMLGLGGLRSIEKINGVIKDCKTAKARQNDEEERELFRKHRETVKGIDNRINKMLKEKGNYVSLED